MIQIGYSLFTSMGILFFRLLIPMGVLFFLKPAMAQNSQPPMPLEVFIGGEKSYMEFVISRSFSPGSNFSFFAVPNLTASYKNDKDVNEIVIPAQISYQTKIGLGAFIGVNMNNVTGVKPVAGPLHFYATKEILLSTMPSIALDRSVLSFFGVYEFKPSLSDDLSLYSRVQILVKHDTVINAHARSYLYLRFGIRLKSFTTGLGFNLDWIGPERNYENSFGPFVGWNF
ncbi:MAG: hypothetical protein OXC03_00900 [Flavobacteriaceae bacterium]|nr:hypothetical protein [Flavobacteriaceae bacterium]